MAEKTFRGFVAIEVGAAVRESLSEFLSKIGPKYPGYRLVPSRNLHITLEFLGNDVDRGLILPITQVIESCTEGVSPFSLSLGDLAYFSGKGPARAIYVSLEKGQETLSALAERVRNSLRSLGFRDERKFQPHITLARRKDPSQDRRVVPVETAIESWAKVYRECKLSWRYLSWEVTELLLMESRLFPEGAVYSVVKAVPIGKGSGQTQR